MRQQVLLVDGHPIMREGFARVIDQEAGLKVCSQADNASKALKDIGSLKPDLVIVDIALKGTNGIELLKRIKALHPEVPVLMKPLQPHAVLTCLLGEMRRVPPFSLHNNEAQFST